MTKPIQIIRIPGSLRRSSYYRATQLLPQDATLEIFELDGLTRATHHAAP